MSHTQAVMFRASRRVSMMTPGRYYSASQVDRARLIAALRQLQIPLASCRLDETAQPAD